MNRVQSKSWCFTINNFEESDIKRLDDLDCQYIIYGKEKGESGTPHLQGYVYFSKRKTFRFAKEAIGSKSHLERAKGSPAQAATYCRKDGDFTERGQLPGGQGERKDLDIVYEKIRSGANLQEIADTHPSAALRYGTGILRMSQFFRPKREKDVYIWTFWGPTGTGKTKRVWDFTDPDQMWVHPGHQWFDGYMGHKAVLFDDFDGSWFKMHYLLKLLDNYVFQVPVKGGYTWWIPYTIFITSNIDPGDWYPNAKSEHKSALLRRLTKFGHIQKCE